MTVVWDLHLLIVITEYHEICLKGKESKPVMPIDDCKRLKRRMEGTMVSKAALK